MEDARGQPPTIPFWFGEAPGRSPELSEAVSRLRAEVDRRLEDANGKSTQSAIDWLVEEVGIDGVAAAQATNYLAAARIALGVMPTRDTLVTERFFDEAGDMHLVIHSPFGSRMNRAWGLALRKRFCRNFNFELQAAATEDAIVLSLGPTHSFPLDEVFGYLRAATVRELLVQAFLDAPMFPTRWRWNASRALAIKRFLGGKKVPPQLQRMDAEDLLAVVFPDQLACLENIIGDREIPDHPLVAQTIRDCLEEAMDIDELESLLRDIEGDTKVLVSRDLREPSPLAHEILAARPYAFLDDAPAEERRTLAVQTRRWSGPENADDLSLLDAAAIDRVREEAWPQVENADELHDALLLHGFLTEGEGLVGDKEVGETDAGGWSALLRELISERRATVLESAPGQRLWLAAERLPQFAAVFGDPARVLRLCPPIDPPAKLATVQWSADKALMEIVRGRLEAIGPTTVEALAADLSLPTPRVEKALIGLETEGFVFRGSFTPVAEQTEWCERRLLARIHRYTLNRLRKEIEPVTGAEFLRFLLRWQRVEPEERAEGPDSLATILEQLEGFDAPAAAWEGEILPARLVEYDPLWLDALCLSGRFVWGRWTPPAHGARIVKNDAEVRPSSDGGETVLVGSASSLVQRPRGGPLRSTPIALLSRHNVPSWQGPAGLPAHRELGLSRAAGSVLEALQERGASFFGDLGDRTGLLATELEGALGELVAWGLVTADSFTGLRALLVPSGRRRLHRGGRRKGTVALFGMENAGRWSLLRQQLSTGTALDRVTEAAGSGFGDPTDPDRDAMLGPAHVDRIARLLLRRYGVVFRRLLARESGLPPWRELVFLYRRLEARREIRGGRFVEGFSGEQFALPEAIGRLRGVRREPHRGTLVSISAADPLNLVGVLTPGERVPAIAGNRVLYRDGIPIALRGKRQTRFLQEMEPARQWEAKNALVRRPVPPQLRAYLGRSA